MLTAQDWLDRGKDLQAHGRSADALASYAEAARLGGETPELLARMAASHVDRRQFDEAFQRLDRALALDPAAPYAHLVRGRLLIRLGHLRDGAAESEWRWRMPGAPDFGFRQPRWQGEPLAGRTLLAIGEAGLGDMLQAARYLVRAARDGARVLVTAPAPLQRLFQRLPGVAGVLGQGDPLPPFDLWTTTGSLAAGFADDLAGIPAEVPYVAPDPALVAAWGARLAAAGPARRRIGIAWAGGRRDHIPGSVLFNSHRSLPLGALAPLWQQPGTAVWALQQGPALSEGDGIAAVRRPDIGDMADTAAIMAHLDLVVTVDTSVAHLAGATGRPVLVMLHATHCERWMVDRPDSPWYPTMRLIRQPTLGDWPPVVEAVVRAVSGQ